MKNLALIAIFGSCIFGICLGICQKPEFTCVANESIIMLNGIELSCPDDKVCNEQNVEPCNSCIAREKRCPYECENDFVLLSGLLFPCPEYYTCNSEKTRSCETCVRKKCADPFFTCHEDNDTVVTIQNMDNYCVEGFVCNKEFGEPCFPCIEREDSPPAEESTTTVGPTNPTEPSATIVDSPPAEESTTTVGPTNPTEPSTTIVGCQNSFEDCDVFKCNAANEKSVEYKGIQFLCPGETVCNINCGFIKKPCIPYEDETNELTEQTTNEEIITKEATYDGTTTEETTTEKITTEEITTKETTTEETTAKEITTEKRTTEKITTRPITTTQKTTTTRRTTTTEAPDLEDCNDGYGKVNPCRRAKKANGYYYFRCNLVSYWYEVQILDCSKLRYDSICRHKNVC